MVRLASFLDERKEPIATPLAPRVKVIKYRGVRNIAMWVIRMQSHQSARALLENLDDTAQ